MTVTTNKTLVLPVINGDFNAWGAELNADLTTIDQALGSELSINVGGGANYTLSVSQVQSLSMKFTGVLTANINVIFPLGIGGFNIINNQTTGAFTLTVITTATGATGQSIVQGKRMLVYADGTNIWPATTDVNTFGFGTQAGFSALLDQTMGSTPGAMLYRGASLWTILAPGVAGQLLQTQGSSPPTWASVGIGGPSQVNTGTSLQGGPINGANPVGTIDIATAGALQLVANKTGSPAIPVATSMTSYLDAVFGSTQGAILFRGSSVWLTLNPGTNGQILQTGGPGADLTWSNAISAGGNNTFTGWNVFKQLGDTMTTPTISGGTLTLDQSTANYFSVTLNANVTNLVLANPLATGTPTGFILEFTATGTPYTVTWPASVKWANGVPPVLTSTNGKQDVFLFWTTNAGTSYKAIISGQNF
jgi:hypothetical protein